MRALAINGSPRKKWNTATLLEHALSGCRVNGAETEMVHLYDHRYQGCISCFACKTIGGKNYGRCGAHDELSPILERAAQAEILILGSPIYLHSETGGMRSFMERLLYPYSTYTPGYASIFPRKIPTALIYTMNVTEQDMYALHQDTSVDASRSNMARVFGSCEVLLCTDTYQFDDYSKYLSTIFDGDAKARRRKDVFPQDCERACELGARLASAVR